MRRTPHSAARPPSRSRDAEAALAALRAQGIDVAVKCLDVSDKGALRQIIGELKLPIRGVVHAAGVLADATIANLNEESLRAVLTPKVAGAWNLHKVLQRIPLDFFVLFSSFASVLGSPGQANYAAANAFLDGLAHYRNSLGLPALSINWGPWDSAGMAANSRFDGIRPLGPAVALQALEKLLRSGRSGQVAVAAVDWGRLGSKCQAICHPCSPKCVASPRHRHTAPARPAERSDGRQFRRAPHIARKPHSGARRKGFRNSAGPSGSHQSLGDLGIDSLTALELATSLEQTLKVSLPLTLMSGEISVSGLAAQIADRLIA